MCYIEKNVYTFYSKEYTTHTCRKRWKGNFSKGVKIRNYSLSYKNDSRGASQITQSQKNKEKII